MTCWWSWGNVRQHGWNLENVEWHGVEYKCPEVQVLFDICKSLIWLQHHFIFYLSNFSWFYVDKKCPYAEWVCWTTKPFAFALDCCMGASQRSHWTNTASFTFRVFRFLFVRTPSHDTQPPNNDNNGQDGYTFCVANLQFSWKHLKISGHSLSPYD